MKLGRNAELLLLRLSMIQNCFSHDEEIGHISLWTMTPFGMAKVWEWENWEQVDIFIAGLDELRTQARKFADRGIPENILRDLDGGFKGR